MAVTTQPLMKMMRPREPENEVRASRKFLQASSVILSEPVSSMELLLVTLRVDFLPNVADMFLLHKHCR